MIDLAQGYFRKTVFKTYRWFKHPRKLKKSAVMRWFATHFLSKQVWKPTQHTMAGGLAIGMCIMIQMFPGQMFVAAVLAAIFRMNIPIAVIACWISNPFTFVPFGWAQKKVGDAMRPILPDFVEHAIEGVMAWLISNLERLPAFIQEALPQHFIERGVEFLTSIYIGGIFIGLALIPISYVLSWVIWEGFHQMAERRRARHTLEGLKSES
jgi:uncharacterized protein (DUF2062 family)